MKTEKLNFVFSLFFIFYGISYVFTLWQSERVKKNEIELYGFCGFIIATVFFNILAYKFDRYYFYLIGAAGFFAFSVIHCLFIFHFIKALIIKSPFANLYAEFPNFANNGFPIGLFGLFSTLFCFQQKYNENYPQIEKPKLTQAFLKICITDFTKCVVIFNATIIIPFLLLFSCRLIFDGFHVSNLLFLIPVLISSIVFLEMYFKSKTLCIAGCVGWGIFVATFVGFSIWKTYKTYHGHIPQEMIFINAIDILTQGFHTFIGISTTLHLYHKYGTENVVDKACFYLMQSTISCFNFLLCKEEKYETFA